jgi:hypothetical protein
MPPSQPRDLGAFSFSGGLGDATGLFSVDFVFGLVCVAIGLAHVALGPAVVPGSIKMNAALDSDDRFYAALFVGFGLALIWPSRELVSCGREF